MKILAQENMKAVTRIFCPVFAKQHLYEPCLASWHQDGQGTLCDDDDEEEDDNDVEDEDNEDEDGDDDDDEDGDED